MLTGPNNCLRARQLQLGSYQFPADTQTLFNLFLMKVLPPKTNHTEQIKFNVQYISKIKEYRVFGQASIEDCNNLYFRVSQYNQKKCVKTFQPNQNIDFDAFQLKLNNYLIEIIRPKKIKLILNEIQKYSKSNQDYKLKEKFNIFRDEKKFMAVIPKNQEKLESQIYNLLFGQQNGIFLPQQVQKEKKANSLQKQKKKINSSYSSLDFSGISQIKRVQPKIQKQQQDRTILQDLEQKEQYIQPISKIFAVKSKTQKQVILTIQKPKNKINQKHLRDWFSKSPHVTFSQIRIQEDESKSNIILDLILNKDYPKAKARKKASKVRFYFQFYKIIRFDHVHKKKVQQFIDTYSNQHCELKIIQGYTKPKIQYQVFRKRILKGDYQKDGANTEPFSVISFCGIITQVTIIQKKYDQMLKNIVQVRKIDIDLLKWQQLSVNKTFQGYFEMIAKDISNGIHSEVKYDKCQFSKNKIEIILHIKKFQLKSNQNLQKQINDKLNERIKIVQIRYEKKLIEKLKNIAIISLDGRVILVCQRSQYQKHINFLERQTKLILKAKQQELNELNELNEFEDEEYRQCFRIVRRMGMMMTKQRQNNYLARITPILSKEKLLSIEIATREVLLDKQNQIYIFNNQLQMTQVTSITEINIFKQSTCLILQNYAMTIQKAIESFESFFGLRQATAYMFLPKGYKMNQLIQKVCKSVKQAIHRIPVKIILIDLNKQKLVVRKSFRKVVSVTKQNFQSALDISWNKSIIEQEIDSAQKIWFTKNGASNIYFSKKGNTKINNAIKSCQNEILLDNEDIQGKQQATHILYTDALQVKSIINEQKFRIRIQKTTDNKTKDKVYCEIEDTQHFLPCQPTDKILQAIYKKQRCAQFYLVLLKIDLREMKQINLFTGFRTNIYCQEQSFSMKKKNQSAQDLLSVKTNNQKIQDLASFIDNSKELSKQKEQQKEQKQQFSIDYHDDNQESASFFEQSSIKSLSDSLKKNHEQEQKSLIILKQPSILEKINRTLKFDLSNLIAFNELIDKAKNRDVEINKFQANFIRIQSFDPQIVKQFTKIAKEIQQKYLK